MKNKTRNKTFKKFFWPAVITVICAVGAALYFSAERGVEVSTTTGSEGDIRRFVEDTAVVKCRDTRTVYIEGSGKIIDVTVEPGDSVIKGDVLVSMDKTDLELQLRDAQARIDAVMAQIRGTELENYANKIELARIAVQQAEIAYETAKSDLENAKKLYEGGALSREDFSKANKSYENAGAALESARLNLEEIKKGTPEYVKQGYKAQLEQAAILRDTIANSLKKQDVTAPINGVVLEKFVEKGSMAVPGTAALVVGDMSALELEANILADDIAGIEIGNEVEISGKALGDKILTGRVAKIAPAARTIMSALGVNQRRVPVTIELSGNGGPLKPGFNVDVKIITEVRTRVPVIPDRAVFEYEGQDFVFVVEGGKAVLRQVKKGIEGTDRVEILDGLSEGEKVIVKPGNNIKEGARIKPD